MKDTIEKLFLQWPGEADDPQLIKSKTYIHANKCVKGFLDGKRNCGN